MATRSRYRLFTAKETIRIIEEAENIGNCAAGRMMYDVTGAKNKTRLTEKNSNRRTFRGQKARQQELKKRLCDYVDDKRQNGYAGTSEMCQLKALAIPRN